MEEVDCVIIGAGVLGLATARSLSAAGLQVIVLEAAGAIGTGVSSRNSEVIHAGIYYQPGSLKAALCVQGRAALYAYCTDRDVPHRRIGKLLVATDESQLAALVAIAERAVNNGVADLVSLSSAAVRALEPAVNCKAAILSPSTGIVDTHALMLALQADAEARGAIVALNSHVCFGEIRNESILLNIGFDAPMWLRARRVVNAAGLDASAVARSLRGFPANLAPPIFYAKGNYFGLTGVPPPFQRLIYPIPDEAGLGVHVTLDLNGRVRFGPDVEWIKDIDYHLDPGAARGFYDSIRRYWPGLPDGALTPDYAGIRPKLVGQGQPAVDFIIQGSRDHGIAGLVNLFGIESPGITASLAIADMVRRELGLH
jgi:L-2-hydroxyglutarate oxidase LhgO